MSLLPRTLFGRTVLVIAVLLVVTQLLTVALIDTLLENTRVHKIGEIEAQRARVVLSAVAHLAPATRAQYRDELRRTYGVHMTDNTSELGPAPPTRGFLGALAQDIRDRMGPGSDVRLGGGGLPRGLWIKDPQRPLWIFIPNAPIEARFPWEWVASMAAALGLAIGGALLLMWRINRPLRELAAAADALARGVPVAWVREHGPEEIRRLSHRFNRMVNDLKRIEDERKLLFAGVSHDVRTPLTRLRLELEMLSSDVAPSIKRSLIADVEIVDAIFEQLLALVQDNRLLPSEQGNVNELIRDVAERYAGEISPPRLILMELPIMRFHALALRRLFTNLIDNAYRHGGGNVEIETQLRSDRVLIQVRDRGPGIAGDNGDPVVPERHVDGRRGLGLAIVNRMTELHQGRLLLRARVGGGLEAEVDLPLAGAAEQFTSAD